MLQLLEGQAPVSSLDSPAAGGFTVSGMTTPTINISALTFDCGDALGVATFWSQLLARPLDEGATSEFASISATPVTLAFAAVPEPKASKNRLHLDLAVPELREATDAAVRLGADLVETFEGWNVLRDPFGNEFCLVG